MNMKKIIEIAKKWNIPFRIGMSKEELIHSIQIKEGYRPCFRTVVACDEGNCLWRDDCISPEWQV